MRQESRFDPHALSAAGARGLMQFIPETAVLLGRRLGLELKPDDLYRPEVSIALAALYLRDLFQRYRGFTPAVVAAYNAGEQAADGWLALSPSRTPEAYVREIGYGETRDYVKRVLLGRSRYGVREGSRQAGANCL